MKGSKLLESSIRASRCKHYSNAFTNSLRVTSRVHIRLQNQIILILINFDCSTEISAFKAALEHERCICRAGRRVVSFHALRRGIVIA